jgi:hypothetical protein
MDSKTESHYKGGPNLSGVAGLMSDAGAESLYVKHLSSNDNSKNQIYFGGSFAVLNMLPLASELTVETISSLRGSAGRDSSRLKAYLNFYWLSLSGPLIKAPGTQLILYPQYPEVRFSGFLRGAEGAPSELMQVNRQGREGGRVLFLGVTADNRILGYVAAPESDAAREILNLDLEPDFGVFSFLSISELLGHESSQTLLLRELSRIHELGWIPAKSLTKYGTERRCKGQNCGGLTLEAELGIRPNSRAEPDFLGWEVKQHDVGRFSRPKKTSITLLTPNPDLGHFAELPLANFIQRYGYADAKGRSGRLNFGGVHRVGQKHDRTGLLLGFNGFDPRDPRRFDPEGALTLTTVQGDVAAAWSFAKLLSHWNQKHEHAVYVPAVKDQRDGVQYYRYGHEIEVGIGTDFTRLLKAMSERAVYFDPGMKLVVREGRPPQSKGRSQFRVRSDMLENLYTQWIRQDVLAR